MTDTQPKTNSVPSLLLSQTPDIPDGVHVTTATIELPPGDSGTPPHRHSGPVFGYMLEGEMIFAPGEEMLTFPSAAELAERADRRAPRPEGR
ncbi:cupin domain-containing protein [Kribbella sp. DT2]|uniref:cupin domain-containing protein n=1 Tax=Kribbella sp. DT2 TaxID=3393427 RepID=UPI003CEA413F